ncbi:MAG: ZIP family metal transporter [Chloroflexota bacterium]
MPVRYATGLSSVGERLPDDSRRLDRPIPTAARRGRLTVAAAGFWAFLGASSLIIGALIGMSGRLTGRPLALLIGFGSGALISAVAYDLIEEAVAVSATGVSVAVGFVAGAVVYFVGDELIERMPGSGGLEILLGAVLDGIPESIVLGLSLVGGAGPSVAVLVAIFISNVPEAASSSAKMQAAGRPAHWVVGIWTLVAIASAVAAAVGYGLFAGAPGDVIAFIDAFAAGAILTLLASDLLPAAHEADKTKIVGLATAAGFAVAAALTLNG